MTHETYDEQEARGPNRPVYVDVTTTGKIDTVISVCGRLGFAVLHKASPLNGGGQMLTFRMSQEEADEYNLPIWVAAIERVAGVLSVTVER